MPRSTPGRPRFRGAELQQPGSPEPAASTPTSRTSLSGMNSWNMPMALDPPPTQATTACGRRPFFSKNWARASRLMTVWNPWTSSGKGWGPAAVPKQ